MRIVIRIFMCCCLMVISWLRFMSIFVILNWLCVWNKYLFIRSLSGLVGVIIE